MRAKSKLERRVMSAICWLLGAHPWCQSLPRYRYCQRCRKMQTLEYTHWPSEEWRDMR